MRHPLNTVVGDFQSVVSSLKNVTLSGQPESFLQMTNNLVSSVISPRNSLTLLTSYPVSLEIRSARDLEKVIL
jgi:hypothetical protein